VRDLDTAPEPFLPFGDGGLARWIASWAIGNHPFVAQPRRQDRLLTGELGATPPFAPFGNGWGCLDEPFPPFADGG
jgi:hypothetical protein